VTIKPRDPAFMPGEDGFRAESDTAKSSRPVPAASLPVGLHGAYDFSATNYFCLREPGNFRGQHQIDFENHIRLQEIFRLEQQTGAADIPGFPIVPILFVETAVLQRQLKVKTLGARQRQLLQPWR